MADQSLPLSVSPWSAKPPCCSARVGQEARERADHVTLNEEAERQQLALECKRAVLEGQIATLCAEFSAEEATIARIFVKDRQREASVAQDKVTMGRSRQHDPLKAAMESVPGTSTENGSREKSVFFALSESRRVCLLVRSSNTAKCVAT
jgi:hypothetical protein